MSVLLPCPFCGGTDVDDGSYAECRTCGAIGPDATKTATGGELWNRRVHTAGPPHIPCEFPDCPNEAVYEGWYRKRDPFFGTPTGHIVRIAFCESCKVHPHLCINEPKKTV